MFQPNWGKPPFPPGQDPPWNYSVDKLFEREHDPVAFTKVLVAAGYRPYRLTAAEKRYTVWAKPGLQVTGWKTKRLQTGEFVETEPIVEAIPPNLFEVAPGTVTPLPIKGRLVATADVILLDPRDGGGIVTGYDRHIRWATGDW